MGITTTSVKSLNIQSYSYQSKLFRLANGSTTVDSKIAKIDVQLKQ
jgi:hypothetical protein